jgi:hypothetical protein
VSARATHERVARERARVIDARRALEAHAEPLARAAGRVHPLVLVGSAFAAGLFAGRAFGRPRLPRAVAPGALATTALERSLAAGLQLLFASLFAPAPPRASDDSTAGSPPGTQSRAP